MPVVDRALVGASHGLFYLVAGVAVHYAAALDDQASAEVDARCYLDVQVAFHAWLQRHETPRIELLADAEQLDVVLNEVYSSCTSDATRFLLLVHDPDRCTDALLDNIARSFVDDGGQSPVRVLELRRPLSAEAATLIAQRLPTLSGACRMLLVLHR